MNDVGPLISEVVSAGLMLFTDGSKLLVRPKGRLTADLRRALVQHKAELIEILLSWPPECAESARRFGQPYARLFPLLGQRVWTPSGDGELVQVFERLACVVIAGRPVFVHPLEVMPLLARGEVH